MGILVLKGKKFMNYTLLFWPVLLFIASPPPLALFLFESIYSGGQAEKNLPHRPNDLPHRPLLLCLDLPNKHGHFDEV